MCSLFVILMKKVNEALVCSSRLYMYMYILLLIIITLCLFLKRSKKIFNLYMEMEGNPNPYDA